MLRKASKQVKNAKIWQRFTRFYFFLGVGVNIAIAAWMEIYVFKLATDARKRELMSCTSYLWIVNNIIYMLMAIIFLVFACKLNQTIKHHIERMKNTYGYEDSHFVSETKAMRYVRNLSIIHIVLSVYSVAHAAIS